MAHKYVVRLCKEFLDFRITYSKFDLLSNAEAFVEDFLKDPCISFAEIFDIEENCFCPDGLEPILTDESLLFAESEGDLSTIVSINKD